MEQALGKQAIKNFQPMQPGDVVATAADTQALEDWVGFKPSTPIELGCKILSNGIEIFIKINCKPICTFYKFGWKIAKETLFKPILRWEIVSSSSYFSLNVNFGRSPKIKIRIN